MKYKKGILLALSVCRKQLRSEAGNTRVYLGYLLGICMALLKTCDYLRYCNGSSIQMFEPFILILNDYTYSVFIMLGLLLIVVDSPFIDGHSIYIVVRSSRRNWYAGIMFSILLQTVFYYGIIFLSTALFSIRTAYVQNSWSQSLYVLGTFQPASALEKYGLSFSGKDILAYLTPGCTFSLTFLLNALYSMFLIYAAFLINLNGRWILGNVVAILIHLTGTVLVKSAYSLLIGKYSLLAHSQLVLHHITDAGVTDLYKSLLLFGGLLLIELVLGTFLIKKADFVIARGDKET